MSFRNVNVEQSEHAPRKLCTTRSRFLCRTGKTPIPKFRQRMAWISLYVFLHCIRRRDFPYSSADRAMPTVRCVPFHQLTSTDIEGWRELLGLSPEYQNPFLTPDFASAVATVRDDVEVALIEEDRKLLAVLPFQRSRQHVGLPVGGALSNCQALISKPGFEISAIRILDQCQLRQFSFHQLVDLRLSDSNARLAAAELQSDQPGTGLRKLPEA